MNQTPDDNPSDPVCPVATWLSVVGTYQCCTRQYELMLSELGLTTAQFDVLTCIARLGAEALPKNIAEGLLVTRSNITPVLQRLSKRGLIVLRSHPQDGRARVAQLTADGDAKLACAMPAAKGFVEAQMAPFSEQDMRTTQQLMQRMHRHLLRLDPVAISRLGDRP